MSCSCVYVGDYDPCEVIRDETMVSSGEFKCCECGSTIKEGETFRFYDMKVDSESPNTIEYPTCLVCENIKDVFFCDGFIFEQVWEDLKNHLEDQ